MNEPGRCPAKHPALEHGQCVLDEGHEGPHDMEGARHQKWQAVDPDFGPGWFKKASEQVKEETKDWPAWERGSEAERREPE